MKRKLFISVAVVLVFIACLANQSMAKSLYLIGDINRNVAPIIAFDIQPAPAYLVYQTVTNIPYRGIGAVGITIDTDSATLFVTYESSNIIQILDAVTMANLGTTPAPGASNLAGIVINQSKQLVYTMDRRTNKLYVYSWDPLTKTLTQVGSPRYLPGITAAYGIALDEPRGHLYVADRLSLTVRYFDVNTWIEAGSFQVTQRPASIAVDIRKRFVYTGNPDPIFIEGGSLHRLSKYDMNSNQETWVDITAFTNEPTDNVIGLAVDSDTGLLYATTGEQTNLGRGSDRLLVFNSNLNLLFSWNVIVGQTRGNPTGLCVPGKQVSYNLPPILSKDDGVSEGGCVYVDRTINYTICYDNSENPGDSRQVIIVDTLPPEVDFISATGGGVYDPADHTVTWDIGTVPAYAPKKCEQLLVKVKKTTVPDTTIGNYATIDTEVNPPTTFFVPTDICPNRPPDTSQAYPSKACLWPPNNKFENISILGVTDPDGDSVTITISRITSDEPTESIGGAAGRKSVV